MLLSEFIEKLSVLRHRPDSKVLLVDGRIVLELAPMGKLPEFVTADASLGRGIGRRFIPIEEWVDLKSSN